MELELGGKVVIVTGGGRGIGAAVVQALRAEGAIPAVVDREGGEIVADLSEPDACRRVVQEVRQKFGRIDGLVNNAGVNDGVGLRSGDPERFVLSLRRNLTHYYEMAHFAVPDLIRSRGAIVNVSSKVAETGQGGTSAYAAANGGRNALTREWAVELAPHGVRVNAVIVAECLTPMYDEWLKTLADPLANKRQIENRIPLGGRMTMPQEVADAVLFMLSSRASHITGQWLHVDGGYVHLDRAANVLRATEAR